MHVPSRDLGRLRAGWHDVVQQIWYPPGRVNAQLTGCALEQGLGPESHSNESASHAFSDTFPSLAPTPDGSGYVAAEQGCSCVDRRNIDKVMIKT